MKTHAGACKFGASTPHSDVVANSLLARMKE
jgi:hypothetical protein